MQPRWRLALVPLILVACSEDASSTPTPTTSSSGGTGGGSATGGGGSATGGSNSTSGGGGTTGTGSGTGGGGGATGGMGCSMGGMGGAGGAAWNPSQLSGLNLWLEASTCVVTSGSNVSSWGDLSGHGNDATQSFLSAQPAVAVSAINGLPAIEFDGVNDSLIIADDPTLNPLLDTYLHLAVGRFVSGSGGYDLWMSKATNAVGSNWRLFRNSVSQLQLYWGNDSQAYGGSTGSVADGTDTIVGWGVDAFTNQLIYVVGSNIERRTVLGQGAGSNALDVRLATDGVQVWSKIRIAEHLFYVRSGAAFPDADIHQLIDYFDAKYALGL